MSLTLYEVNMKNKPVLAIIGGGASGITAAIFAAKKSKNQIKIIILERMDRIGKKILATGNGRCNFSNVLTTENNFHGKNPEFTAYALSEFSPYSAIDFFSSLGVLAKEEANGKLYPYSDQASAILDALRFELERLDIEIKTNFEVSEIIPQKTGFKIISKNKESLFSKKVILSTGGCAAPNLGSNGSGFKLLKELNHKVTKLMPALVQLKTEEKEVKSLQGIKFNGVATAFVDDERLSSEEGEILFTDYGLSGPPIFQLSVLTALYKNVKIKLDFMPEYNKKAVFDLLKERKELLSHLTCESFFNGLLNKKIGHIIAKKSGIEKLSMQVSDISEDIIWKMCDLIKQMNFTITDTKGFNNAQVTAGGVLTRDFDDKTMESKIVKGLYCTGEVFDIYGDCGGYNLQWAFSSAYVAAENAVKEMKF